MEDCEKCEGTGWTAYNVGWMGTDKETCDECNGTGKSDN